MRFCFYNNIFKVKDEESLPKKYKKLNANKDKYLMDVCHNIMHVVLKRRKSLFEGISPAKLFPTKIGYTFHGQGGIQQLCSANSPNKKVNTKILKLRKELGIDK